VDELTALNPSMLRTVTRPTRRSICICLPVRQRSMSSALLRFLKPSVPRGASPRGHGRHTGSVAHQFHVSLPELAMPINCARQTPCKEWKRWWCARSVAALLRARDVHVRKATRWSPLPIGLAYRLPNCATEPHQRREGRPGHRLHVAEPAAHRMHRASCRDAVEPPPEKSSHAAGETARLTKLLRLQQRNTKRFRQREQAHTEVACERRPQRKARQQRGTARREVEELESKREHAMSREEKQVGKQAARKKSSSN